MRGRWYDAEEWARRPETRRSGALTHDEVRATGIVISSVAAAPVARAVRGAGARDEK